MKRISTLLLSVVLLIGCSPPSEEISTPDVGPATTTLLMTSEGPSPVSPSRTATLSPGRVPTTAPTRTLMPSLTREQPSQVVSSPDGTLVAKMYESYWRSFSTQVIEVQDNQGEVVWAIPYQGEMPRVDPHPTMRISGWAPDGSAVYFYYSFAYDGWYTIFDGSDLQALDVKDGTLKAIVAGACIAFSFSPDMGGIAYTRGGRVGIYDIATGDDRSVGIPSESIDQAGRIHWSPSGDGLVFTVLVDDRANAREIYVDAQSMKQKVLLEAFIEDYDFDGWTQTESARYLRVNRESGGTGSREVVVIDTKTTTLLVVGTPTPEP